MSLHTVFFVFATILALTIADEEEKPLTDDFIDLIHTIQKSWKAGHNFPPETKLDMLKYLTGTGMDLNYTSTLPIIEHENSVIATLPEQFDCREKWLKCPSLYEVRDQGSCGGCWAIAAVSTMTDRYCINSKAKKCFDFSADDLISCCTHNSINCTSDCTGGTLGDAWRYFEKVGIVSGGNYKSSQGCRPYEIPPCEYNANKSRPCTPSVTPKCDRTCRNDYKRIYTDDVRYGTPAYTMTGEADMRAEIFLKGPITSRFDVYSDFLMYKSGVYRQVAGTILGGHAIKIIGWGVENNEKYWTATNSWSTAWGDKGFFKIVRGEYHCGIEGVVVAGEPIMNATSTSDAAALCDPSERVKRFIGDHA